ncbi:CopD family protein [Kineosporia rhizophila]|uniref:copper resistance CopC/CopD family protein n=1 Tax=Kineosporia rhizophila TaxID=84633 RepID=UPI001E4C52E2|nr:CopD family protein [Kineosporia rhizophila]
MRRVAHRLTLRCPTTFLAPARSDMIKQTAAQRSPWPRRLLLVFLVLTGSLMVAYPAAAHLKLVSTTPGDGGTLKNPSAGVSITFSKEATPHGNGFALYNSAGTSVPVRTHTTDDGLTWKIQPTRALETGGRYGLTWSVVAGDAHPKSGTITFRVAQQSPADATSAAVPQTSSAPSPHTESQHPPSDPDAHAETPGHTSSEHNTAGDGAALDALLSSQEEEGASLVAVGAAGARWVSFAGVLVSVGALLVVVTTLVGSSGDVRLAERVVRVAAGLAVVGAVAEGARLLGETGTPVPWSPAVAVALRLLAGVALIVTLRLVPRSAGGRRSHDVPALPGATEGGRYGPVDDGQRQVRSRTQDFKGQSAQLLLTPPVRTGRVRGVPSAPGTTAVICLLMLLSFVFDGHTASVGPRPVTAAADLAHTAAAAVWVGGVVLLAVLLLVRARAGVPTGAGELAVRFSVPATAAVVVAGVAGTVLAFLIVESPGDLIGTDWGRVMIAKLVLVGVVAVMGYVNNRYALPALDAWRPGTARLLRRTVALEAAVMIAVLLVTAVLVGSQS